MKTVAILQARTGSSRLPGKVLADLCGKPVLVHCLDRAKAIEGVDAVCLATTTSPGDDAVADLAGNVPGVTIFRGSEADVLGRYLGAAQETGAEVVLRLTCDCPLIDPEICAAVIALRAEAEAPYATNVMERDWPHGLDCEAFPMAELEQAAAEATEPYDREHVTPYIRRHAGTRAVNLGGPGGAAAEQRWTLDYPEDLAFLRALFPLLPQDRRAGWREVMAVIEKHPEIAAINTDRAIPAQGKAAS